MALANPRPTLGDGAPERSMKRSGAGPRRARAGKGKLDRKSKERQGESGGVSPPGEPQAGAPQSVRSEGGLSPSVRISQECFLACLIEAVGPTLLRAARASPAPPAGWV